MSSRLKRVGTPAVVGGAAMAAAVAVALTTTVPQVLARDRVELAATITPGSATNWNADGIDQFYGINWNATYGDTAIAPFRLVQFWKGAENILTALDAAQTDGEPDVVVSSGRGAGNASAALTWLAATDPDGARLHDTLWILDNNVDRPNGGYAARYPFFALVGVNPVPVPNDLEDVQILDIGYQYAWNSSAPTYISNLPALLNAIIAYAYRYRQQDKLPIPEEILTADGQLAPGAQGHYIIGTDGKIVRVDPVRDGVTTVYVTFETDGLPMLKPIRDFGGDLGNAFADVVEPALTVLVNASYTDNDPFADPSVYTPLQLIAPPKVWATAARQLPGALAEGWDKLQEHRGGGAVDDSAKLEAKAIPASPEPSPATGRPGAAGLTADARPAKSTKAAGAGQHGEDTDRGPRWRVGRGPVAEMVRDAVASVSKRGGPAGVKPGRQPDEATEKASEMAEEGAADDGNKADKAEPARDRGNSADASTGNAN
ncbi:MAG: PE-PPE domain-containing protein [Mycobacterium sp.]